MDKNGVKLDVCEGAREMVDLSADAVGHLGSHLIQIGDIIAKSTLPPGKGERGLAKKLQDKFVFYKAYCDEVARRKAELETKMADDYNRLCEWRKSAGQEGAGLLETMERLFDEARALKQKMGHEQGLVYEEKQKVQELIVVGEKKVRKFAGLAEEFVHRTLKAKIDVLRPRLFSCWVQYSFHEIRHKQKAAEEREKLKLEHHRKMRKARCQARLDVIVRSREARLLQAVFVALQEEGVEARAVRHLEMLRTQYRDHVLVLEAQLAQAVGDEEAAAKMVAEQVRRLEEARAEARESELKMKMAQRQARAAEAEAEEQKFQKEKALKAEAVALERARVAEEEAEVSRKLADEATQRAEASDAARNRAEQSQRDAEEQVRKKAKKIASLQRMLAELGAESDSDAPPDERPPAFFLNEDGTRQPRERTRKERMGMAYREAESARIELRLGMAAMIDKEVNSAALLQRLRTELTDHQREVQEVRSHNKQLAADADAAVAAAAAAAAEADAALAAATAAAAEAAAAKELRRTDSAMPRTPLKPNVTNSTLSTTASTLSFAPKHAWGSPALTSPTFAGAIGASPLLRATSQPALVPAVRGDGPALMKVVAPLRKVRRAPGDWHPGWH
jgi:hypothetical protein